LAPVLHRLQGTVTGTDGEPIAGALVSVRLVDTDGLAIPRWMGKTSHQGDFLLQGLPGGIEARIGVTADTSGV
jgi:hypothetical protein